MIEKPPIHRVDAPAIFIHQSDSAWDMQRYNDELEKIQAEGGETSHHPLSRYFGGWTRFDLSAKSEIGGSMVSPSDYLLEGKSPTKWHLRRLSYEEYYEIRDLAMAAWSKGLTPTKAYIKAAQLGIKKVENFPEDLAGPPGPLSRKDMERLFEYRTDERDLLYDIGSAVYAVSMPLSDVEKKP